MSKYNIGFYGSHNSSICISKNNYILCVIELERFLNSKNIGHSQYMPAYSRKFFIEYILRWIKKKYNINNFENCIYLNTDTIEDGNFIFYEKLINSKNYITYTHHQAHAASSFYQTNFKKALIISFDGGGNDGFFNIYYASNRKTITEIQRLDIDLGFPYMIFGHYIDDIKFEPGLNIGNLVYPGKLMGLSSYGKIRNDWYEPIKKFYLSKPNGENYENLLNVLGEEIGLTFDIHQRIKSHDSYDLSKTSQKVFEDIFMDIIDPFLKKYNNIPLILSGGCALNILLNTRLNNTLDRDIFIPPNPNDCGISSGLLLNYIKPKKAIDLTYKGISVLDEDVLMSLCEDSYNVDIFNILEVAKDLKDGKIIGVVRGMSEHGPRALGNRSILCNPTFDNMKDILNVKVKNREWYRPFAPVVRLEDVSKYFEFNKESRWMSFCPLVKKEYRDELVSITHVDGTARVQTVTEDQNSFLYSLLTEFYNQTGIGVLLNTSFNKSSKPLVSTYRDAYDLFKNTNMDRLLLGDYYFRK
jgi:carbamoyltransferase